MSKVVQYYPSSLRRIAIGGEQLRCRCYALGNGFWTLKHSYAAPNSTEMAMKKCSFARLPVFWGGAGGCAPLRDNPCWQTGSPCSEPFKHQALSGQKGSSWNDLVLRHCESLGDMLSPWELRLRCSRCSHKLRLLAAFPLLPTCSLA